MRALALLSCLASLSSAQDRDNPHESPSQISISNDMFEAYDFARVKKGHWVEYELIEDGEKFKHRLACVEIEEGTAWLESTLGPPKDPDAHMLYGVDTTSGLIKSAHIDGGTKLIAVKVKEPTAGGSKRELLSLEAVAHGDDNQRAGDKTLPCQKSEFIAKFAPKGSSKSKQTDKGVKGRVLLWTSDKIPFPYRGWRESGWLLGMTGIQWKPREPPCGGLVRVEMEAWEAIRFRTRESVVKVVLKVSRFGDDAKPDLYMRR